MRVPSDQVVGLDTELAHGRRLYLALAAGAGWKYVAEPCLDEEPSVEPGGHPLSNRLHHSCTRIRYAFIWLCPTVGQFKERDINQEGPL